MKKEFVVVVLLVIFASGAAFARFEEATPSGGGNSANTWSWSTMKQAVVQKISAWWNSGNQGSVSPKGDEKNSREVASTSDSNDINKDSGENSAAASQPSTITMTGPAAPPPPAADSWNPFKRFFARLKESTTTQGSSGTSGVSPDVNIKGMAPKVKEISVARTAAPAVPFSDKNLILGHNGIPVFEFKKMHNKIQQTHVKKIPLLNVGSEEVLDSKAFEVVNLIPFPEVPYEAPRVLDTPRVADFNEFSQMMGGPLDMVLPPQNILVPALEPGQKVTAEKIAKLVYALIQDMPVTPLPVTVIAEDDLKLLRGLILYEKKDQCHVASGIFSDLLSSQREEIANSAEYHLGICLHEMNLPTESMYHLGKVMHGKNENFARDSVKVSLEDLQLQHEGELVEVLSSVDPKVLPEPAVPQIDYLRAKYNLRKGHPEKALEYAVKVPTNNPFFYRAQYVASVAEYELGKEEASITRQKTVSAELAKKGSDKDILALFEMNLGRVAFQKGKYKDSLESYQKIPRENALWMQGLMELGWVQIQSKDTAGAIGNMHSIQSPYFDGVYKPESYVVRTIGYLNLCQFPDAAKSLGYLEFRYGPWLTKVQEYLKGHNGDQSYATVLKMLQTKGNQDIDGLPVQVLREVARQKDFLNAQEALNQLVDENTGYTFVKGLIEKDKKSLLLRRNATINKVAELNNKIKKAHTTPDAMKNFNSWKFELANYEDFLAVYEFKVKTLKEGQEGLARMTPKAQERIASRRETFKESAGKLLKSHLVRVAKDLTQQLDNNELLKYEVYAGSGENLRYQMAGGKTGGPGKAGADRKPSGMKWDFDGEYWADEIGNYRSSLKNNCQNTQQVAGQRKGN